MLVHLPDGYTPEKVRDALAEKVKTRPEAVRLSLTWDQGPEMRDWKQVSVAADIDIFFCDPHAPWQRGSNENTNGLLRQYFPKGSDLAPTPQPTSTGSPRSSTTDPANASATTSPSKRSANYCCADRQNPPFGLPDAERFASPGSVLPGQSSDCTPSRARA